MIAIAWSHICSRRYLGRGAGKRGEPTLSAAHPRGLTVSTWAKRTEKAALTKAAEGEQRPLVAACARALD